MNKEKQENVSDKRFIKFVIIWIGQFISILGSGLSSFGLSLWILNETGSATSFAMSFFFNILPTIIFAPFAGSFADRKSRKTIIMLSDSLDALLKIIMVLLLVTNNMKLWMVYPILFISSTLGTFQGPAFDASVPMLVDKNKLSRANGMLQLSYSLESMITPVLAGFLYTLISFKGLLIIDFATFFFAIFTIMFVKIPQPQVDKSDKSMFTTAFKDSKLAWGYMKQRRGFIGLILVFSLLNFIANTCIVLLGPLVMSTYNESIYGVTQGIYGLGMVVGGLIASILPNVNKKVKAMFLALIVSSIGLVISGISSFWIVIALGFFIFILLVPYSNTLLRSIVQTSFDASVLGRVLALLSALLKLVTPVACILSGILSDNIFEPLMKSNNIISNSIGSIIGTGTGRGIGLLFILCGIILGLVCIISLNNKNIMSLDNPD